MPNYGKTTKHICFESIDKLHADLKIRLHYDGIKIKEFFNEIVKAYLENNQHVINFIEEVKESKTISKSKRNKVIRERSKANKITEQFGLNNEEIENIFDILEKEHNL